MIKFSLSTISLFAMINSACTEHPEASPQDTASNDQAVSSASERPTLRDLLRVFRDVCLDNANDQSAQIAAIEASPLGFEEFSDDTGFVRYAVDGYVATLSNLNGWPQCGFDQWVDYTDTNENAEGVVVGFLGLSRDIAVEGVTGASGWSRMAPYGEQQIWFDLSMESGRRIARLSVHVYPLPEEAN